MKRLPTDTVATAFCAVLVNLTNAATERRGYNFEHGSLS
jgi:hypothetical protein